jgi:hypothetical protein
MKFGAKGNKNVLVNTVLEKTKPRSENTQFHASLLENGLKRFQFGTVQVTLLMEPKVVLPKPALMNCGHWSYVVS